MVDRGWIDPITVLLVTALAPIGWPHQEQTKLPHDASEFDPDRDSPLCLGGMAKP